MTKRTPLRSFLAWTMGSCDRDRFATASLKSTPVLAILLVGMLAPPAPAQGCTTTVFQGNIPPSPWTAAGSPYCVTSSITIPFPLLIQPGVTIQVQGPHSITAAVLTVSGTPAQPVIFRAGGTATSWKGLILPGSGATLSYCQVQDATDSGIQIQAAPATLDHCTIVANNAASGAAGGGLRISQQPGPTGTISIRDSQVCGNTTTAGSGGGVSATLTTGTTLALLRTWVYDNAAIGGSGGGLMANVATGGNLTIDDCRFVRNAANAASNNGDCYGGGLYLGGGGSASLTLTTITECRSDSYCRYACPAQTAGAGVFIDMARVTLSSCEVSRNVAQADSTYIARALGSGIYCGANAGAVDLWNCLVSCNNALAVSGGLPAQGGGLFCAAGTVNLRHCSLINNSCSGGAAGSALYVAGGTTNAKDSIVFYNTGGSQIVGAPTITYSCVQGGYQGSGNITADPALTNKLGCDASELAITGVSPCVDAGDPITPANDDAKLPPGFGGSRGDIGFLGGPQNGTWLRLAPPPPLTLASYPATTKTPAEISFDLVGATPGDAAAVFLVSVNQIPNSPYWLDLFGLVSVSSNWTRSFQLPALAPLVFTSIEVQGVTLHNGLLSFSPICSVKLK